MKSCDEDEKEQLQIKNQLKMTLSREDILNIKVIDIFLIYFIEKNGIYEGSDAFEQPFDFLF